MREEILPRVKYTNNLKKQDNYPGLRDTMQSNSDIGLIVWSLVKKINLLSFRLNNLKQAAFKLINAACLFVE